MLDMQLLSLPSLSKPVAPIHNITKNKELSRKKTTWSLFFLDFGILFSIVYIRRKYETEIESEKVG